MFELFVYNNNNNKSLFQTQSPYTTEFDKHVTQLVITCIHDTIITLSHDQCIVWYATISKHLTLEAPLSSLYIL